MFSFFSSQNRFYTCVNILWDLIVSSPPKHQGGEPILEFWNLGGGRTFWNRLGGEVSGGGNHFLHIFQGGGLNSGPHILYLNKATKADGLIVWDSFSVLGNVGTGLLWFGMWEPGTFDLESGKRGPLIFTCFHETFFRNVTAYAKWYNASLISLLLVRNGFLFCRFICTHLALYFILA